MAERPNAPALKAGDRKVRGFKSLSLRSSGEVEAVEPHDLVPRGHEVTHELLL